MKTLINILILTCILITNAFSQLSQYNFNNNIDDQINTNDADYLFNGIISAASPTYLSNGGTIEIELDPIEGLEFPSTLINGVDTMTSLEIAFQFRVTDIGTGKGRADLWNCQVQANEPGFALYVLHDEFSNADDFDIVFSYADGGFNQGVPDHPGHDETNIGYQLEGDIVDVRLIIDFENRNWSTIVNGNYVNKNFDDEAYDWDLVRQSLIDNEWYFGWHKGQDVDMAFSPNIWTSTLSLDDLSFYSPRQPGNVATLITALQEMTAHANGSLPLTLAQRNIHLVEIYLNYFNNHNLVSTEVYDFIDAYEMNYPPVYANRNVVPLTSLEPESQLLIFLQQAIFDNEYTLANVASLNGISYEFSDIFPGTVDPVATRVINAVVEVNGTYNHDPAARVVLDLEPVKRPLGYYAAPGEIVTIDIPPSLINAGLSVMIGAHDADHSSLSVTNRFRRISKTYELNTSSTDIISPFGGALYFKVEEGSQLGWFNVTINGAVKSPYFSWRNGRKTNPAVWAADLADHHVEWVDIESDKYMMTLPLGHVASITDPTQLITDYDEIMEGYRYVGGRPNPRPRAEYFAIDSRLPSGAFGTGYPQIIGEDSAPFAPYGSFEYYPTHILNPNFWDSAINTTFHERGHAVLHPTLVDEVETIIHVPATYVYNQVFNLSIDDAFKYSSQEFLTLNEAAMDWMISFNFRNNNDMGCDPTMANLVCDELRYQHRGHAKYADMANLLGWQTMYNMNNVFYNEWTANGMNSFIVTKDNVLEAASVANGVNMAPLFHFWGLAPSPTLKAELDLLSASPEIYNQLLAYYNLIPETQAEFLSYRDILLSRKDPVHFDRINDAYNNFEAENYTQQMRDQICNIIDLYFSGVAPCNSINSSINLEVDNSCINIHPNPTGNIFALEGDFQNYTIQVIAQNGTIEQELTGQASPILIDITNLPVGLYFIKVVNTNNTSICVQRIIKTN